MKYLYVSVFECSWKRFSYSLSLTLEALLVGVSSQILRNNKSLIIIVMVFHCIIIGIQGTR